MIPLGDVREGDGWQDIPPIGEGIENDDAIVFATPTHLVTVIKGKTVSLSDYLKRVSAGTTTPPYQHLTPPLMTFNPEHPTTRRPSQIAYPEKHSGAYIQRLIRAQCLPEEDITNPHSRYIFMADEIDAKNIWNQLMLAIRTGDERALMTVWTAYLVQRGSQPIKTEFHPGLYLNKSDRYTLAPIYLQRTFPNFVKINPISMVHSPNYFFPRSEVIELIEGKISNNMREVDMNLSAKLGFKEDRVIIRPAISTSVGSTIDHAQWWEQVKEAYPFWDPASSKAWVSLHMVMKILWPF